MTAIPKTAKDLRVTPNLTDYDRTCAEFAWSTVADPCAGMAGNGCNIAFAAVDRHVDGPIASRTALRFVSAASWDGAMATRDLSYAELGRLSCRFTNVLRTLGIDKGDRVFTLLGHCPGTFCHRDERPAQRQRRLSDAEGLRRRRRHPDCDHHVGHARCRPPRQRRASRRALSECHQ